MIWPTFLCVAVDVMLDMCFLMVVVVVVVVVFE